MSTTDASTQATSKSVQGLDETDRAIIDLLSADARMSNASVAEAIGVAPSTALVRTRSLVERGIISGFHAAVSLQAMGRPVQALIAVKLRAHDRDEIDRFTAAATHLPDVLEMFHLSGGTDYMLRIAVASTDALRDWVLDNLTTDESVAHTETTLIFAHHPGTGVASRHI
jgi:DNA-binding Lrp family transcriptional regulator